MTNMDNIGKVLQFVTRYPGCAQSDISLKTGISPEQQVNSILRKLIERGSVRRSDRERPYTYYPVLSGKDEGPQVPSAVPVAAEPEKGSPGESKEQQEAEKWLVKEFSEKTGVALVKRRVYLDNRNWVEVDGFSASPPLLCEAWAHIGPPKSAQKNKVMSDALKMLFVDSRLGTKSRRTLLLCDTEAAKPFQKGGWRGQCLETYTIGVEIVELPSQIKAKVIAAQKRQYR